MGRPAAQQIKTCLDELNSGDGSAAERLIPLIYDELRVSSGTSFSAAGSRTTSPAGRSPRARG